MGQWQWLKRLPAMLAALRPETAEHARRQLALQRNVLLPARLSVVAIVFYLQATPWLAQAVNAYGVMIETIQNVFAGYAFFVIGVTVLFFVVRRFPPGTVPWIVFAIGLVDGVFLGGLTVLTGGFESILYWVYPALIVLNAVSIPLATPQIVLNLLLGIFFLTAGLIESSTGPELSLGSLRGRLVKKLSAEDIQNPLALAAWLKQSPAPMDTLIWAKLSDNTQRKISAPPETWATDETLRAALVNDLNAIFAGPPRIAGPTAQSEIPETAADPYILRVAVLLLLTFCCYGVQVLAAGQKLAEEEQKEFVVRTEQLRGAGRLAAEGAQQIQNPPAIIDNVAFSLQKNLNPAKPEVARQFGIIREEIAKADRILTQIMGYAQLSEGRVERLNVGEELHRIIAEVFPPGLPTGTQIQHDFAAELPPLLMQRQHFADAVGNLLQNARDAVAGGGHIFIRAHLAGEDTIAITVRDDGPGIPPDKRELIFEAYYTTKPRGTGLGLAVVKHNTELYGGGVQVESELGKGSQFTLSFPAKTLMRPAP